MRSPTTMAWLRIAALLIALSGVAVAQAPVDIPGASPKLDLPPELTELLGSQPAGDNDQHVRFSATYQLREGTREGQISLTADIDPGWHLYSVTQPPGGPTKSTIKVKAPEVEVLGKFVPDRPPHAEFNDIFGVIVEDHEIRVVWTAPIRLKEGVDPEKLVLPIQFDGQVCMDAGQCILLSDISVEARFTGYVKELVASPQGGNARSEQEPKPSSQSPKLDFDQLNAQSDLGGDRSLLVVLAAAFCAGFILNFMPCVLPVVGLKIISFVQQAGESRGRILALNLWYTLGLLSVFVVLATLAVLFGLAWGAQFNDTTFNVVLAAVVFAFALSFLGVWEVPLPGFATGGKMDDLSRKEGPAGAFFKGVLTTILATPCTGPMLGPALTWAVKQPPAITYLAFVSVGLGMGLPYIVIGIFPKLVSFLPKPGAWMDTFKHVMGFVLLGTVVLLLTFIPESYYVIPVVAFLIGLWAALWWIGRVPVYEPLGARLRAWLQGAVFAAFIGWISFGWLLRVMEGRYLEDIEHQIAVRMEGSGTSVVTIHRQRPPHELDWRPFSLDAVENYISQSKTVFIDFTAPS